MRVLCIHGNGGDPEGFRRELIALEEELRRFVGFVVEFDYFAIEAMPSDNPSVLQDHVKESPHWTPFHASDTSAVRKSVATLYEYILAHGPYNGVLAFSMGAALASTAMMLYDQIACNTSTEGQPLFQFAIFVSGVPPQLASLLPELTDDAIPKNDWIQIARSTATDVLKEVERLAGNKNKEDPLASNRAGCDDAISRASEKFATKIDVQTLSLNLTSLQSIPTIHMMGGPNDYLLNGSLALFKMSEGMGYARYVEHHEGHSMPNSSVSLRKLALTCSEVMNQILADAKPRKLEDACIERSKELSVYNWCRWARNSREQLHKDLPSIWNIVEEKLETHHTVWKAVLGNDYGMEGKEEQDSW